MASTGEAFGLFWDSENGDRTYSAASFEYWLKKFFTSGVFNGDLQVKATSGMTLEVEAGYTNADGKVKFWNAPFNVTLDAANSTYPRIDTVVIRRDNVNRQITCEKVTGAYSADTPQPTAPTRNSEIFELVIAQIYVGAGVTGITQSNITDTRPNNELCGYITGTVEELDFSAFTAQFEAYFAEFKRNQMADFQAWEVAQQAAYAAWFSLVQQQQIQDKADWDAWYAALQEELHELPEDTAEYLQIEIDEIRTSGTTGSILKITTTETSLEGKTVTVTNGTETRTATFDENLECLIAGYKGTGEVTISSSDGIQTATTVVTIPYFGNYTYNIAFWAATVNIQGDDNLKGATITVKDSDDLTVGTVVLNVITGRGVFTAQKADTYTFNFTYQGTDYSESLVVDEETTYSLSLSAGFDWRGWVDTARFLDSTDYNSLDEVLEDKEAVRELCLEHNCVDYLADITTASEDVETIINNDLFAKWVNNSDYALDFLGANVVIKALMDTADKYGYGEWCLMPQVPKMTSNTAPYGTVTRSSIYNSAWESWKAFDGDESTRWIAAATTDTQYIEYEFVNAVRISSYMFKLNDLSVAQNYYGNIYLKASNDGQNYVTLDTITASSLTDATVSRTVNNDNSYTKYRIEYTKVGVNDDGFVTIQFYAYAPKGNVPAMTSNSAPYGTAFASTENSTSAQAWKAFDKNLNSQWYMTVADTSPYIGYHFTNPVIAKFAHVELLSQGWTSTSVVGYIEGSNDGSTYQKISEDITFDGLSTTSAVNNTRYDVDIDTSTYYLYYRLHFNGAMMVNGGKLVVVNELQFYGRELSVSVPTMTGSTTPYGEVKASTYYDNNYLPYKAFDRVDITSNSYYAWIPSRSDAFGSANVSYDFGKMVKLGMFSVGFVKGSTSVTNFHYKIQGSTDGTTWEDIIQDTALPSLNAWHTYSASGIYRYFRLLYLSNSTNDIFAGRGWKLQFYGLDYSEKEFEEGATKKWLYDHGVELETIHDYSSGSYQHGPSSINMEQLTSGYVAIAYAELDTSLYDLVRAKVGSIIANTVYIRAYTTTIASLIGGATYSSSDMPNNGGYDISSVTGVNDIGIAVLGVGKCELKEMWLE